MRMEQYDATLENIDEGKIAFGMGYGYFFNDLGWGENERVDERLAGMESVVFGYLLERGIVGLALWATFYILIFFYLIQNRSNYKSITGLGMSFLVLYLLLLLLQSHNHFLIHLPIYQRYNALLLDLLAQ